MSKKTYVPVRLSSDQMNKIESLVNRIPWMNRSDIIRTIVDGVTEDEVIRYIKDGIGNNQAEAPGGI